MAEYIGAQSRAYAVALVEEAGLAEAVEFDTAGQLPARFADNHDAKSVCGPNPTPLYQMSRHYKALARSLEEQLRSCEFGIIVGIDGSGRIPALVMHKLAKKLAAARREPSPKAAFLAGNKLRGLLDADERVELMGKLNEHVRRHLRPPAGKKILIVDDMISKGASLRPICEALRTQNIPFEVAALMAETTGDDLGDFYDLREFEGVPLHKGQAYMNVDPLSSDRPPACDRPLTAISSGKNFFMKGNAVPMRQRLSGGQLVLSLTTCSKSSTWKRPQKSEVLEDSRSWREGLISKPPFLHEGTGLRGDAASGPSGSERVIRCCLPACA